MPFSATKPSVAGERTSTMALPIATTSYFGTSKRGSVKWMLQQGAAV